MKGKVERWIDLSGLPKQKCGRIDWRKSINISAPLKYGDKNGHIKILKRFSGDKYEVELIVNNSVFLHTLSGDEISGCKFGGALKKPIAETHPDLIKYFLYESDAYKYSYGSGKKVDMKCPLCGTIKSQNIQSLVNYGFACPACSDGISWPNKFMFAVLTQLKIDFDREVTCKTDGFEWIPNSYRYDFYIRVDDKKILIEMDGHFHFEDGFKPCEQVCITDDLKDQLANEHDIEVIRINCKYNIVQQRFEYIQKNIMNSRLSEVLDLSCVDWNNALSTANTSNSMYQVAKHWNENMSVTDIAKVMKISVSTVREKLIIASKAGLCDYTPQKSKQKGLEKSHEIIRHIRSKHVLVSYNNIDVGVFYSAAELSKLSEELYGVVFDIASISCVCNKKRNSLYGYKMRYIPDDEYEEMLLQYKINLGD